LDASTTTTTYLVHPIELALPEQLGTMTAGNCYTSHNYFYCSLLLATTTTAADLLSVGAHWTCDHEVIGLTLGRDLIKWLLL